MDPNCKALTKFVTETLENRCALRVLWIMLLLCYRTVNSELDITTVIDVGNWGYSRFLMYSSRGAPE